MAGKPTATYRRLKYIYPPARPFASNPTQTLSSNIASCFRLRVALSSDLAPERALQGCDVLKGHLSFQDLGGSINRVTAEPNIDPNMMSSIN